MQWLTPCEGQRGLVTFMLNESVRRAGFTEKEQSSSSSGALFFSRELPLRTTDLSSFKPHCPFFRFEGTYIIPSQLAFESPDE